MWSHLGHHNVLLSKTFTLIHRCYVGWTSWTNCTEDKKIQYLRKKKLYAPVQNTWLLLGPYAVCFVLIDLVFFFCFKAKCKNIHRLGLWTSESEAKMLRFFNSVHSAVRFKQLILCRWNKLCGPTFPTTCCSVHIACSCLTSDIHLNWSRLPALSFKVAVCVGKCQRYRHHNIIFSWISTGLYYMQHRKCTF